MTSSGAGWGGFWGKLPLWFTCIYVQFILLLNHRVGCQEFLCAICSLHGNHVTELTGTCLGVWFANCFHHQFCHVNVMKTALDSEFLNAQKLPVMPVTLQERQGGLISQHFCLMKSSGSWRTSCQNYSAWLGLRMRGKPNTPLIWQLLFCWQQSPSVWRRGTRPAWVKSGRNMSRGTSTITGKGLYLSRKQDNTLHLLPFQHLWAFLSLLLNF